MTDVTTHLTVDLNNPIRVARINNRPDYFRFLFAAALIPLGGFVTVGWIAFLGWAAGKLFNVW
jgi:hypothetical protein